MSWFFGKKKHKDSLPETPSEESEPSAQDDNFIFIERRDPNAETGEDAAQSFGLYPSIHGSTPYPHVSPQLPKQHSLGETLHYLHNIPFKLCRELEKTLSNDLELEKLRVSEFVAILERLNVDSYEHDFSLERGIVAEIDSTKNDEMS